MKDVNKDGDASDGAALANSDFGTSAFQGSAYTQTPHMGVTATAAAAYTHVLAHAGARWWQRGPVDTRLVAETRAGTGKIIAWADDPFNSGGERRHRMARPHRYAPDRAARRLTTPTTTACRTRGKRRTA